MAKKRMTVDGGVKPVGQRSAYYQAFYRLWRRHESGISDIYSKEKEGRNERRYCC